MDSPEQFLARIGSDRFAVLTAPNAGRTRRGYRAGFDHAALFGVGGLTCAETGDLCRLFRASHSDADCGSETESVESRRSVATRPSQQPPSRCPPPLALLVPLTRGLVPRLDRVP